MTLSELIAELQKYPPETLAKRFDPIPEQYRSGLEQDDVDVVAVINRDGYVAIV
jgi:hypothetical protein